MAAPHDAPEILRYYRENARYFAPSSPTAALLPPNFLTVEYQEKNIVSNLLLYERDEAARLWFFTNEGLELVGRCSFSRITRGPFQACNLGYQGSEVHEGKGYMIEGLRLAIGFAFDDLNLHRIEANHLPENDRSARVLAALGFTREGYAKQYLHIAGEWRDHVLNSLTHPAWKPQS